MSGLHYSFHNPTLLAEALTVPASTRPGADNQRLEFLGDAVLQLLVSERLYARYPKADEGVLTDMRMHLVSGDALLKRSDRLGPKGLRSLLKTANPGLTWPEKALTDAVEAVVGAAFLDGGYAAANILTDTLFKEEDWQSVAHCTGVSDNPKGELQQLGQKAYGEEPVYALIASEGPSHAPRFRCSAALAGRTAEGTGRTRRRAEADAAAHLLKMLD